MNIFRELVEELRDENLLEETVREPQQEDPENVEVREELAEEAEDLEPRQMVLPSNEFEGDTDAIEAMEEIEAEGPGGIPVDESPDSEIQPEEEQLAEPKASDDVAQKEQDDTETTAVLSDEHVEPVPLADWDEDSQAPKPAEAESAESAKERRIRSVEEEKQFYRQRAMDEVIGLQLVEHVLSGVEREQMKSAPKTFDDLAVKRALHDFLKVADDLNSPEHAKAEFQLMQETENWCSSLSRRDRNISVSHLRRYCETTKPSLSSQALISLARFYRNSPYSESVRSKFDLVFTKLFSKDQGGELRSVVFRNGELITHIQELYADWSSIPLYSTDEDDSELLLTALKFQDFINESVTAESFDELVRKDFFKRLKVFKEKTSENFFAPLVVAAAIESNVAVGNRYVELIEMERMRSAGNEIVDKYGVTHDNAISEATSKTLELLDVLQAKKPEVQKQAAPPEARSEPAAPIHAETAEPDTPALQFSVRGGANKWLIVATVVVLSVTAWLFLQGNMDIVQRSPNVTTAAREFGVSGTSLAEYVQSAKISRGTMYGITTGAFNQLSDEEKREVVEKAVTMGVGNDFQKVHFLDGTGKSLAFGSKSKVTVY